MKKTAFTLDLPAIDFSDVAFLSILTDTPDFALADDLNRLYDIALHRVDDAQFDDLSLPLYHHADPMRHLDTFLLRLTPAAEGFLLLFRGSSCREAAAAVERDFVTPPSEPHPADLPAVRRHSILVRYQSAFTPVSLVEFADEELAVAAAPGRRTLRGRPALADLFARILDTLDLRQGTDL